jgi:hypothetical protein
MNQRIQKLAEQAREYATTRHQVSNIVLSINNDKFEQKFAELIVRECADFVSRWERFQIEQEFHHGGIQCGGGKELKRHFGVEE